MHAVLRHGVGRPSARFLSDVAAFGQLTYMRIYQGMLKKGNQIVNINDGKKIKLSRIVRMHSDEMEEIEEAHAGDVVAMFGIDCRRCRHSYIELVVVVLWGVVWLSVGMR